MKLHLPLKAAVLVFACGAPAAHASEYTGPVISVLLGNAGSTDPRVSIQVPARTVPCGSSLTWYAYEGGDVAIGKIWTAALLTAYATGKPVRIVGTGTCDLYGVEIVSYIGLQ